MLFFSMKWGKMKDKNSFTPLLLRQKTSKESRSQRRAAELRAENDFAPEGHWAVSPGHGPGY